MTTTTPALDLDAAYACCAEITRREARNFSYGINLLPPLKRRAMTAVYAMARRIDDIGDGTAPAAEKLELLYGIRRDLAELGRSDQRRDLVLVALADAVHRLPIPIGAFDELIDGCCADVTGQHYETFEDLRWYCRCVAGSVGRLSVGIYDPSSMDAALPLADSLGIALQLTNILRDLREDRLNGRIYLPAEDLRRFDCQLGVDDAGTLGDPAENFAALVRFEAERARSWYAEGLRLLPLLDRRSAACTAAMAGIYRRLLERITRNPACVRSARQSLSTPAKLRVAARAVLLARA
jgi:phytoene synthase